jgi:hypothetical protein
MKLDIIAQIWNMTRESIMAIDRDVIAEGMVGILIDNDFSAAEIKSTFRDDEDIIAALKAYVEDAVEFEEEESEYEEYDEENLDDYNDDWE